MEKIDLNKFVVILHDRSIDEQCKSLDSFSFNQQPNIIIAEDGDRNEVII